MQKSTISRKLIIFFIGIFFIALFAFLLRPRPVVVEMGSVSKGPLQIMVESEGRTQIKNVYTISAPVSGRLLRIPLKAGDAVIAEKTVLARIDPPHPVMLDTRTIAERRVKVNSSVALNALARAEVNRAKAALDYANADHKRNEALNAKKFIAQQALEKSQLEVRIKQAELIVAEDNLKSRESELEMNKALLLPTRLSNQSSSSDGVISVIVESNGKVLKVLQESESFISGGTPILEIGDPTNLEILLEILSENAAKIRVEAKARILGWGGKTLQGRVRRIEPYGFTKVSALGIEEQRVNVLIDFVDPLEDWQLMEHGYRVDAQIVSWENDKTLKMPMGALFRNKNKWAVFRVSAENIIELRYVEIGHSNNLEAEMVNGLEYDDRIVLYPSDTLQSGMSVSVATE